VFVEAADRVNCGLDFAIGLSFLSSQQNPVF